MYIDLTRHCGKTHRKASAVLEKCMAQFLHVGLYWCFDNLPFGICAIYVNVKVKWCEKCDVSLGWILVLKLMIDDWWRGCWSKWTWKQRRQWPRKRNKQKQKKTTTWKTKHKKNRRNTVQKNNVSYHCATSIIWQLLNTRFFLLRAWVKYSMGEILYFTKLNFSENFKASLKLFHFRFTTRNGTSQLHSFILPP